jgi:hypothetical protein
MDLDKTYNLLTNREIILTHKEYQKGDTFGLSPFYEWRKVMKTYVQGIIFGIMSILSGLLFTGIPFGTEMIEIVNVAVLVIGVFAVLIIGIFLKKYTAALTTSAVYMVVSFALMMFIETQMSGFTVVHAGFLPGLSMAITGLVTSMQLKGNRKILAGMILSVVGILINAASLVLTMVNGFVG